MWRRVALALVTLACSAEPAPEEQVLEFSTAYDALRHDDGRRAESSRHRGGPGRKMMIIGTMTSLMVGNVTDDAIYIDRIAADLGGPRHMKVLIVPGASASPRFLETYFRALMPARGVLPRNIELAHIASRDDDSTPDEDESQWDEGAYAPSEVEKLARANVVWFSGGDQSRLTSLLLEEDGDPSPFHAALEAKFAAGRVILAGYSAGAAAMSDPMIGAGTSWEALTLPLQSDPLCNDPGLCVAPGLGYLPSEYSAVVDQHFTQRGRFARSIRALAATNLRNAWGVSEFSGFYLDLDQGLGEVVGVPGKAFVTLLGRDGAEQNHETLGPPFLGDQYTMSLLTTGDIYQLPSADHPHGIASHLQPDEVYLPFSEYYADNPTATSAFGSQVLVDEVAVNFADATPSASGAKTDAIAFRMDDDGVGTGFLFRFTADDDSLVAYNGDSGYSFFDARVAISTIAVRIDGVGP